MCVSLLYPFHLQILDYLLDVINPGLVILFESTRVFADLDSENELITCLILKINVLFSGNLHLFVNYHMIDLESEVDFDFV